MVSSGATAAAQARGHGAHVGWVPTGYLGGAVATHVRAGDPLFTHDLFGVYVGVLAWLGLYLRDPRLRLLVPLRARD
jgi:hypothetical protein